MRWRSECLAREGNESHLERVNVSATGCVGTNVPILLSAGVQHCNWIRSFVPRLGGWEAGSVGGLGLTGPAPGAISARVVACAATNDAATLTAFQHPRLPLPDSQKSVMPCVPHGLLQLLQYDWLETHPRLLSLDAQEHQSLSKIHPSARKLGSQVYEWCENGLRCSRASSHASSQIRQCSVGSSLTSPEAGYQIRIRGPAGGERGRLETLPCSKSECCPWCTEL